MAPHIPSPIIGDRILPQYVERPWWLTAILALISLAVTVVLVSWLFQGYAIIDRNRMGWFPNMLITGFFGIGMFALLRLLWWRQFKAFCVWLGSFR